MPPADAPAKAIGVLRNRVEKLVGDHSNTTERNVLAWYDNLANRYGTTLRQLEAQRDAACVHLNRYLKDLGYA